MSGLINRLCLRKGEEEIQLKKGPLVLSFALSILLEVGTTGFAHGSDSDGAANMLNANEKGMTNMMNAMNSTEG